MKKILILLCVAYLAGCAMGNKYDYEASSIDLSVKSAEHKSLILSVEDWRPYVLNGDKKPNFVGLQRGGFGNPFDVTTASGKPMTEDMAAAIVRGLKDADYNVTNIPGKHEIVYLVEAANKNGASRIVLLKVFDWKSDIYMGTKLHCNLQLSIFDGEGKLLAENTMKFVEDIGGGHIGGEANSQALSEEFAKRIGYLFNKDEVRRALH